MAPSRPLANTTMYTTIQYRISGSFIVNDRRSIATVDHGLNWGRVAKPRNAISERNRRSEAETGKEHHRPHKVLGVGYGVAGFRRWLIND